MRILMAVAVLLVACGLQAQTAKVIELKPEDAREAQSKWETLKKAQADWDAFSTRIQRQYTMEPRNGYHEAPCLEGNDASIACYKNGGWERGIEFSEDMKAIVPKPLMYSRTPSIWTNSPLNIDRCWVPTSSGTTSAPIPSSQ